MSWCSSPSEPQRSELVHFNSPPQEFTKQQPKLHRDQDPGTTEPEGNSTHLNYKFFFFFFLDTQIFPVLVVNSLCKNIFLIFLANSLCFPCLEKWTFKFPVFPVPWQP